MQRLRLTHGLGGSGAHDEAGLRAGIAPGQAVVRRVLQPDRGYHHRGGPGLHQGGHGAQEEIPPHLLRGCTPGQRLVVHATLQPGPLPRVAMHVQVTPLSIFQSYSDSLSDSD